jgi:hypothetical protein
MAQIGSLVVDLILKSATFNADMAKSARAVEVNTGRMQRSIAGIEGGLTRAGSALKTFGATVAIGAVARALATVAKNAIDVGDEIGEAASKLGIGTDQLQRLRFAAEQTDVDVVALNNALKQFQKTIATGKAPYTTFDAVIAKIAEADTQTEKVAIGFKYFGKQYQAALLIAANGADAFKKSMDGAFTISERGVRIASDLDNQLRAVGNAITAGFNEGFLTGFNDALADTGDHLKDVNTAMLGLGSAIGAAFAKASTTIAAIAKFAADHPKLMEFMFSPTLGIGMEEPSTRIAAATGAGRGVRPPMEGFTGGSHPPGGLVNDEAIAKMAADAAAEQAEAEAAATQKIADAKTAATNAQKALNEQQALYKSLLEGSRTPQEQYRAALEQITKAHADGELGSRLQTMAAANLTNAYLGLASTAVGALATLFKDSKAVAVAQAVINTAQAITATLAQYGATPWGLAAAGVAAAAGAAQIATIVSTSTGSNKKPAVGASSSSAKGASGAGKGMSGRGSGQAVTINLQGQGGFSREQVRSLAEQLNGLVADGATIRTNG